VWEKQQNSHGWASLILKPCVSTTTYEKFGEKPALRGKTCAI
jgi:hypothetical protein